MRVTVNLQIKKSKMRNDSKCPIYVRCTMDGKRIEFSTGIYVLENEWDENGQMLLGRSEKVKIWNNRLDKFVTKIYDVYNQLESGGDTFDVISIKEKLIGKKSRYDLLWLFDKVIASIESKLGNGYALGTIKHYRTTRSRMKEFISVYYKTGDIPLEKINYELLDSFDSFLKRKNNISGNTAWGYHRHLKKVLNDAVAMNLLQKNPYGIFRVKRVEANFVTQNLFARFAHVMLISIGTNQHNHVERIFDKLPEPFLALLLQLFNSEL